MKKAITARRCPWCLGSELEQLYHDTEWGVPTRDTRKLFEALTLEGAQAGLSWATILKKREGYREAFAEFDLERVARFTQRDVTRLMKNPGIVRHRGKIESVITNAKALLAIAETQTVAEFFWNFVDETPIVSSARTLKALPNSSAESSAMSKDLKRKGFSFVGPTTCYSFMQATGMVNDHLVDCFRYSEIKERA